MLFAAIKHSFIRSPTARVIGQVLPNRRLYTHPEQAGSGQAWRSPLLKDMVDSDQDGSRDINGRGKTGEDIVKNTGALRPKSLGEIKEIMRESDHLDKPSSFAIDQNSKDDPYLVEEDFELEDDASIDNDNNALDIQAQHEHLMRKQRQQEDHETYRLQQTRFIRWVTLKALLATGNPAALLQFVSGQSADAHFMTLIPSTTFIEILRQIQPDHTFLPLTPSYRALGPKHYRSFRGLRVKFYQNLKNQKTMIQKIILGRMRTERRLGLGEYTQMMNIARALWDGEFARMILQQMGRDGIEPDITCYNHYLEARCWSSTYLPEERQALRNVPLRTGKRTSSGPQTTRYGLPYYGHRVGNEGINSEVAEIIARMTRHGIRPNIKTYLHLITAKAREGDIVGVKHILDRTWGVNVDQVLAGEKNHTPAETDDVASDLHPSEDLLFTVAHAFGINNDMYAAVRVVDHFSQTFNIPISRNVWAELLGWAFVMTRERNQNTSVGGTAAGQLPSQSLDNLWDTMTGESYKVKPTLPMYDLIVRHHYKGDRHHKMLHWMREGVKSHEETKKSGLQRTFDEKTGIKVLESFDPALYDSILTTEREMWSSLQTSRKLIQRWLYLLLAGKRWIVTEGEGLRISRVERLERLERCLIPDSVREFWEYRDEDSIQYSIQTGWISLTEINGFRRPNASNGGFDNVKRTRNNAQEHQAGSEAGFFTTSPI